MGAGWGHGFRSTCVRQAGSWRPSDAQLGWIIENRVDEAYLLSWPGQLETYVPLHDTGGYDRARGRLGSYDFRLDQIKGTASAYLKDQVEIGFTTPALHPNPNLDFTFVGFHLPTRELIDPAWLVPSEKLARFAPPPARHATVGHAGFSPPAALGSPAIARRSTRSRSVNWLQPGAGPSCLPNSTNPPPPLRGRVGVGGLYLAYPRTPSRRAPSSSGTSMPPSWKRLPATRS